MLYLFTGDDSKNKHIAYENFVKNIPQGVETFYISRNNFDRVLFESFCSSSGLFFSKSFIIFSNIFEYEEIRNFILDKLKEMGDSENSFVFLEGKLTKPIIDSFKKSRAEINIFELSKTQKEKFDSFLLANAFGIKDKLNLWIYFRQAIEKGVAMEELVGVLFWKAKDMILKKNFSKFSENELKSFAAKLAYILPEARQKGFDAESALEQFLLEVF